MAGVIWGIEPDVFQTLQTAAAMPVQDREARLAPFVARGPAGHSPASGAVAVLPMFGPISHRAGFFESIFGFSMGTSLDRFTAQFRQAMNDPNVKCVVIQCDSPGGTVEGVPELADEIMKSKAKKPVIAVADGRMASAAYWLCSAASEVVCTPSGSVGSIGVFMAHEDVSKALDREGVKVTLIAAGRYKTEGNSYEPLTPEARATMQKSVDRYGDMFVMSVAAGRGVSAFDVSQKYGQGRMLSARDALAAGMIDRIACIDETVQQRSSGRLGAGRRLALSAASEVLEISASTPSQPMLAAARKPSMQPVGSPTAAPSTEITLHHSSTNARPTAPQPGMPARPAAAPHFIEVVDNRAAKPWANIGEQLCAIARFTITNGADLEPRLFAAASGNNENVDSEGGFLVAPEFAQQLIQRTYNTGVLASRCRPIPMLSSRAILPAIDEDSRVDGSRFGGIQAYWQVEASTYTPTKPKFREMQLTANKLIGLCWATEELVSDAMLLSAFLGDAFPKEFAFKIDDAIVSGAGAGLPLGFVNSTAALIIAKESGQSSATIVTNNILKMDARLPASSQERAVWLANVDVKPQLYPLVLGSGTAVSQLFNADTGRMLGHPVIFIEQAATLGSQGDLMLVDLAEYLLAQKVGGVRSDVSIHVQYLTGEMAFRFQVRVDGQPAWKKPLTPKNGTNTQSPFVVLGAR